MNQNVEKALNEQIRKEEYSSRLYLAMAIWCEANGYPGAATFLYEHAEEERMHMLKLVHYVNDRDGHAKLLDVEVPPLNYTSVLKLTRKIILPQISYNGISPNKLKKKVYSVLYLIKLNLLVMTKQACSILIKNWKVWPPELLRVQNKLLAHD